MSIPTDAELPAATPNEPDQRDALRPRLIAARLALPDRHERAVQLQSVLRVWLARRQETAIGGYWPIKGEFDPLPALYRWAEADDQRRIGLPVVDKVARSLKFHVWFPGCPMEPDAYDIPKPKGTDTFAPQLVLLPCLGYGVEGVRIGYGGGFFDRIVNAMQPKPITVGLCYSNGFMPMLRARAHDLSLDALLTDDGVAWQRD